jgi:hypothetical protein
MFLGHFALGVAAKPAAPRLPIWAPFLAPQAMDVVFLPLTAIGVEGSSHGDYGQSEIDAAYSHSILSALAIAGLVFWITKRVWKSDRSAWKKGIQAFNAPVLQFVSPYAQPRTGPLVHTISTRNRTPYYIWRVGNLLSRYSLWGKVASPLWKKLIQNWPP